MNELLFLLRVGAAMAVVAVLALVVWRRRKRVVASVCAHLGLEADPFAREARPAEAHRCYANLARERIDLGHQQRFCLASTHNKCPFLATSVQRETGVLLAMRARWRTVSPAIGLVAGRLGRDFAAGLAVANMARDAGRPRTLERLDWRTSAADAGAATVRLGGLVMRLSTMAVRQLVQLRAWTIAHARQPQVVEAVVVVEESTRGAVVAEAEPEALLVLALEPPRMETVVPADPAGPGLSNRVAAAERDLIERGIAAVQEGLGAEAYQLFKRATEVDKHAVRAWFWRAKTSETLAEVVSCLERARQLDPGNVQIAANLDWAHARLAAAKSTDQRAQVEVPKVAVAVIGAPHRRALGWRVLRLSREVCRAAAALAAFVVAAAWLLGALPPQLHEALVSASGIRELPLPAMNRLNDLVHYSLAGGYDVGSALPFGAGFLALFVGMGLLSGDGWTRLWAPVVGVASAWAWSLAPGAAVSAYLLPACGAVVLGGALSGEWRVLRLD